MIREAELKNLEEMTNQIAHYVWEVASDDEEATDMMLVIASKFITGSFFGKGANEQVVITGPEIISRCTFLADVCMRGGHK